MFFLFFLGGGPVINPDVQLCKEKEVSSVEGRAEGGIISCKCQLDADFPYKQ